MIFHLHHTNPLRQMPAPPGLQQSRRYHGAPLPSLHQSRPHRGRLPLVLYILKQCSTFSVHSKMTQPHKISVKYRVSSPCCVVRGKQTTSISISRGTPIRVVSFYKRGNIIKTTSREQNPHSTHEGSLKKHTTTALLNHNIRNNTHNGKLTQQAQESISSRQRAHKTHHHIKKYQLYTG